MKNPMYQEPEQETVWVADFDGTLFNTEKVANTGPSFFYKKNITFAFSNIDEDGKVKYIYRDIEGEEEQKEYDLINIKAVQLLNQRIQAGEKMVILSSGDIPKIVYEVLKTKQSRLKKTREKLTNPESELLFLLKNSLASLLMNKSDLSRDDDRSKITKNTKAKKIGSWFSSRKNEFKNIFTGKKCCYLGNGIGDLISVEILEKRIEAKEVEFINASIDKDADEFRNLDLIEIEEFSSDLIGKDLKWWQSTSDKFPKKDGTKFYIEIENEEARKRYYLHTPDYCLDKECVENKNLEVFSGYEHEHQLENQQVSSESTETKTPKTNDLTREKQSEKTKEQMPALKTQPSTATPLGNNTKEQTNSI